MMFTLHLQVLTLACVLGELQSRLACIVAVSVSECLQRGV